MYLSTYFHVYEFMTYITLSLFISIYIRICVCYIYNTLPNQQQTHKQYTQNHMQVQPQTASHPPSIFIQKYNKNSNKSVIPDYGQITINPFLQLQSRNKRILTSPSFLAVQQIPQPYHTDFIKQLQYISGMQNLFPILLELTTKYIYVCSKDCFIAFPINDVNKYEKVKLPEMPTCFRAYGDFLYFGLRSGQIIIYNIVTKNTVANIDEFVFSVLQIQIINKDTFLAMDLHGNLKVLTVSFKMFMDRVLKVSSSAVDLIQQFRVKKRDKLKNLVKNLPFRKQKQKQKQKVEQNTTQTQSQTQTQTSSQSQHKKQHNNWKQHQISKFCILPEQLRTPQSNYPLIYYHKGQLKCLTLSPSNQKLSQQPILQSTQGTLGMLQLGQGGFTHSNQAHIILVLSIDNTISYYRQIHVQNQLQFIKISNIEHSCKIYNGKFISNNLLVFMTQQGIQLSNVNGTISILHKINYDKFNYIDFFNEEQQFNFDKRLLYANILKVGQKQDNNCIWCCLQGKRILYGQVQNWKNYLSKMSQNLQWQKCMKCALMIYMDVITHLGGIAQNVQQRNQSMRQMLQKITLTYISYQLKNSQNPLQSAQIIHKAIDFMVRTQSFTYLFTTIYQCVRSYGLERVFLEQLEQYVESGSIKWMTEEVLNRVIEHYTNVQVQVPVQGVENVKGVKKIDENVKQDKKIEVNKIQQKQGNVENVVEHEHKQQQQHADQKQQKQQGQKSQQQPQQQPSISPPFSPQLPQPLPLFHSHPAPHPKSPAQLQLQQEQQLVQNRQHLQTMIMNFNLQKMQKSLLLSICLNNELYQSLIHICKQQHDYVTPILKLCGLRVSKMGMLEKLVEMDKVARRDRMDKMEKQQSKQSKQKQQKQQNKQEDIKQKQQHKSSSIPTNPQTLSLKITKLYKQLHSLTQIIFHYLYQCLIGHLTQFDNTKQYLQMLQQLVRFIFIPSSLLMLLQSSSQLTFMILNMIFGAKIMQYVFENAGLFVVKRCQYVSGREGYKRYQDKQSKQIKQIKQKQSRQRQRQRQRQNVYQIQQNRYNNKQLSQIITDILQIQSQLSIYSYAGRTHLQHSNINNTHPTHAQIKYYSTFSNYNQYFLYPQQHIHTYSQITQQFNIYNNILSIVVYTIINNYSTHHTTSTSTSTSTNRSLLQTQIISQLSQSQTSTTQWIQQYQYKLSEKEQSQLHIYHCHKFITYLILTNSFPIRLGWKLIAYQFIILFPYAFYCYDDGQGHIHINNSSVAAGGLYRRKSSRRYSVIRYQEYSEQDRKQGIVNSMIMRVIDAIVREVGIAVTYLSDNVSYISKNVGKYEHVQGQEQKQRLKSSTSVRSIRSNKSITHQQTIEQIKQHNTRIILNNLLQSMEYIVSNKKYSKYPRKKSSSFSRTSSNPSKIQSTIMQGQQYQYQQQQYRQKKQHYQLLIPSKCYILDLLQQYEKLIATLLSSRRETVKMEVFVYLGEKVQELLKGIKAEGRNANNRGAGDANGNIGSASNKGSKTSLESQKKIPKTDSIKHIPPKSAKISLSNNSLIHTLLIHLPKLLALSSSNTLSLLQSIVSALIQTNSITLPQITQLTDKLSQLSQPSHPQTQLSFIQHIIHTYQDLLHLPIDIQHEHNISSSQILKNIQTLAIRHLQVVLQHKKQQLQEYVLRINYPLQQAFKVCQQCNNKTAMAYILIKSGRNLQGVMLISDLFISNSREVFRDLAKNNQNSNTNILIDKMTEQLNKILQTCTNQYINDIHKGEQMWEKIAQKLFKELNVKVIDTIPIVKIKDILQIYVDQIIRAIFTQVNPQFFIQKFSQNTKMVGIPTRLYLQAHDLVYERLGFKFEINSITKQLLRGYQMKIYQNLLKNNNLGVALNLSQQKCQKCGFILYEKSQNIIENNQNIMRINQLTGQNNQITNIGRILVYNCGHGYHVGCYQDIVQNRKAVQKIRQQSVPKISLKPKFNICPHCNSQWDGVIYGDLKTDPERYSDIRRERKKSILIERKNKLAEFDGCGYFQVDEKLLSAS